MAENNTATMSPAAGTKTTPIIDARGITKRYGAVEALTDVDFTLNEGEVVGLLGDNGAGKSTLIKILSGATHPDEGEIFIDGKPIVMSNPKIAQANGIETLFQDMALFEDLSIAANMCIGREVRAWGPFLDHAKMLQFATDMVNKLKIDIPRPRATVRTLSGGQRQAVAIARSVAYGSRVVILDEPTSALSANASEQVLQIIRDLRDHGLSQIVVTHNLVHVMSIADRLVILRRGRLVGDVKTSEATPEEVVRLIVSG